MNACYKLASISETIARRPEQKIILVSGTFVHIKLVIRYMYFLISKVLEVNVNVTCAQLHNILSNVLFKKSLN